MMWKEDMDASHSLLLIIFIIFFGLVGFFWVISSLASIKYTREIYLFCFIQIFIIFILNTIINQIRKTKHELLKDIFVFIIIFSAVFFLPVPFLMGFSAPEPIRISVLDKIIFYYFLIAIFLLLLLKMIEFKTKKEVKPKNDNE